MPVCYSFRRAPELRTLVGPRKPHHMAHVRKSMASRAADGGCAKSCWYREIARIVDHQCHVSRLLRGKHDVIRARGRTAIEQVARARVPQSPKRGLLQGVYDVTIATRTAATGVGVGDGSSTAVLVSLQTNSSMQNSGHASNPN